MDENATPMGGDQSGAPMTPPATPSEGGPMAEPTPETPGADGAGM